MSKIKVENIVKTFNRHSRNANKVLKGVSFELPEKGLTCIFGKSGSGKTTLLNIIGGLEKPIAVRFISTANVRAVKPIRSETQKSASFSRTTILKKATR